MAQQATPPRIAAVLSTAPAAASVRLAAFQQGMKALGYVEGQTIVIDAHSWVGATRPLAELAAHVVRSNPAVIVVEGNSPIAALKQATTTIPIVMSVVGDPVGSGFVASIVRPGGNITGLANSAEQLTAKRLELLKELVPGLTRVGVLHNPTNRTHPIFIRETEAAAKTLAVTPVNYAFASEADLERAFGSSARDRVEAFVVLPQPLAIALRGSLADGALRHRIPVMFPSPEPVEVGGLASYSPRHTDLWERAATYVDRILKGARPADLPIEQPTRFDLVLNLKTARALALTIPPSLLLRAQTID
ncbi:MAG TPA: ABC transporter substrate-binding protein [Methylomirabilota bacterium]